MRRRFVGGWGIARASLGFFGASETSAFRMQGFPNAGSARQAEPTADRLVLRFEISKIDCGRRRAGAWARTAAH